MNRHEQSILFKQLLIEAADQIDDLADLLNDYPDVTVSFERCFELGRPVLTLNTDRSDDLPNSEFMHLCRWFADSGYQVQVRTEGIFMVAVCEHGDWSVSVKGWRPDPGRVVETFAVLPVGAA